MAPRTAAGTLPLAELYERLRDVIPAIEWPVHAEQLEAIERLKRLRNAVILAHNYMTPEIFHGAADLRGDSLALARQAARTDADVIVMCGVHFMAETAKILNPGKVVLIPDPEAGCSLAASITADDVRRLKAEHPGVPVVTYVNTSAEVKAESDVCCTSGNAVEVVESLGVDRVIFLPDEYLGKHVASRAGVTLILWHGHCEVHERFTAAEISELRSSYPGIHVVAHPECAPEVLAASDYVGSTAGMVRHLEAVRPESAVLVTECSMSDNVAVQIPETRFVRPCNLCPHMKRITLQKVRACLEGMTGRVEVAPEVAARARRAVERMLAVGEGRRS